MLDGSGERRVSEGCWSEPEAPLPTPKASMRSEKILRMRDMTLLDIPPLQEEWGVGGG